MAKKTGVKERLKIRIRKNDMVKVISGRDKGKTGRVLSVDRSHNRLLVEGIMMIKRHTKANPSRQIKGGIAEKESPIHVSNVMILTSGGVPTRIATKMEGEAGRGRRVRVARKTAEILDRKQ
jgi:large subunit ribosomal protein L24